MHLNVYFEAVIVSVLIFELQGVVKISNLLEILSLFRQSKNFCRIEVRSAIITL